MIKPHVSTTMNDGIKVKTKPTWAKPFVLILSALLLTACGNSHQKAAGGEAREQPAASGGAKERAAEAGEASKIAMTEDERKAVGLVVEPVAQRDLAAQVSGTATIEANQDRRASIAAPVAGRVTRVVAGLGERVKAGQALAYIYSGEMAEAQAALAQARSEFALAQAGMERADKLFADQIIPQKEHLRARADLEKARAALRGATGRLGAYGARARDGEGVFAVTSPLAGTVIDRKAAVGELAEPDKALFEVADLSSVWITINLYEKDLARVKTGSAVDISVAAYPNEQFKGKVDYIGSAVDSATRTVPARVSLPNPDGRLKLGMFATTAISAGGNGQALLVPADAVVLVLGQPSVFVQEGDGFEPRPVQVGDKRGGDVVLSSGIVPGTRVVTHGAYALKAKMLKSQISAE